jgi:hypothetical protein
MTDEPVDRLKNRLANRCTNGQGFGETEGITVNKRKEKQIKGPTNRQKERKTNRQTNMTFLPFVNYLFFFWCWDPALQHKQYQLDLA